MDLSTLYWVLILPSVGKLIGVLSGLALVGGLLSGFLIWLFSGDSPDEEVAIALGKRIITSSLKITIPIIILTSFIPTQKMMMYIIGGYVVTNVEGLEKLPKNVVGAANKFLEQFNIEEQLKESK